LIWRWNTCELTSTLPMRRGPPPRVGTEQFREQHTRYERQLSRLARAVNDRESSYVTEAAGLRLLDRALLAVRQGLAGKARGLLLESDIAAFGPQGMALELELLLRTGRVKEVREWAAPEHKVALGPASYHCSRQQADAMVIGGLLRLEEGEADEAEAAFRAALTSWTGEVGSASGTASGFAGRTIAQVCLAWLELARDTK
jgi:hypothetical protein